ncbi:MAG: hypothetical protein N3A55_04240 [Methylohalobius sp.]|nr:hypothetical protein [Methylohalobius sp.]
MDRPARFERPTTPADFVNLRFGVYGGEDDEFGSFSIWPVVDWGATGGAVGLSWTEASVFRASLLSDLSPQELQRILATSPIVNAWVR